MPSAVGLGSPRRYRFRPRPLRGAGGGARRRPQQCANDPQQREDDSDDEQEVVALAQRCHAEHDQRRQVQGGEQEPEESGHVAAPFGGSGWGGTSRGSDPLVPSLRPGAAAGKVADPRTAAGTPPPRLTRGPSWRRPRATEKRASRPGHFMRAGWSPLARPATLVLERYERHTVDRWRAIRRHRARGGRP